MHIWFCANAASGSNDDEAVRAVLEAFASAGASPARVVDVPSHGAPSLDEVTRAGIDLIAVFAGDGTVNAVVGGLEGWGGKVLVLPGGTANLLSRALHGERTATEIVAALPGLQPVRRPCIRTGAGLALIGAVVLARGDVRQ